ncbi:High-affinity nickel-transporter [Brevibacillus ginsengisoli]|uniref:HoxN/HupN/NixA family nickel/cobalt transporter n=1 Tax=Brevibacillus ginsengisoli TaxID=363854 RepID=UPI003CEC3D9E
MFIDVLSVTIYAVLMGFRHGMDSDHIAAIVDMVGAEQQRKKQLRMGITYALGHGSIVMVIGLLAIFFGSHLPESVLVVLERLVGISLVVLGGFMLFTLIRQRKDYQHQSRFEMGYRLISRMFTKSEMKPNLQKWGVIGAFCIGILHGIGAETPTQVMLISSSVGLNNFGTACMQLMFFTVGLLVATFMVTYVASWGFINLKARQWAYLLLGCITGAYSVVLGITIIQGV